MSTVKYTRDHEWISVDGKIATVGITDYAQEQLGDLVFVELPEIGKTFDQGESAAVVESVKAASEIYAPVGGEITEANGALGDAPEKVNEDATGDGWIFKMKIADTTELDELMDEAAYKDYLTSLE
jgi:glycine cleavage system H protein